MCHLGFGMHSFRIVTADYYLGAPVNDLDPTYSSFGFCAVTQVPVIRIFGVTPTGEKACIHIHGVLPYIYVPFPVGSNASGFMYQMSNELDSALNKAIDVSYHKKHIFKMSLVSGIPFYGYHSKNQDFIKIFFYHPYTVKKAVQILQSGIICNQKFQPHESHVPYVLQFFIDYNLYGMSFLNLSECFFRQSQKESEMSVGGSQSLIKVSNCQIEVDASAEKIMNKESIAERTVANPGLAQIWEEEKERRRKEGLSSQAEQEESQERRNSPTASDLMYRAELLLGLKRRQEEEAISPEPVPESVASQEASFREDHSSQKAAEKSTTEVALDEQDMALIETLMTRFQEEETPEDDSILGSQEPAEDASDSEADLTLPLLLAEEDNDEVDIFSGCEVIQLHSPDEREPELSDTLMWPELEGLSQIDGQSDSPQSKTSSKILKRPFLTDQKEKPFEFLFIDGSIDDDDELEKMKTPEKKKKKVKQSPHRYRPLDVRMYKSPRKQAEKEEEKPRVSSPELFRKFEQRVSEINRKIRSPSHSPLGNKSKIVDLGEDNEKNKTHKKIKDVLNKGRLLRKRYNSLPVELLKKTKIVEETEPSESEDSSGNTSSHDFEKLFSERDIIKMKKEIVSAKKVLFEENASKNSNDSGSMCLDDSVRKVTFKEGSLVVTISPSNGSSDEIIVNNLSESIEECCSVRQEILGNQVDYMEKIEAESNSRHEMSIKMNITHDKKLDNQSSMEESSFDATLNSQAACVSFYDNTLGLLSNCTIAQTPNSEIYTPLSNPPTRDEVLKNLNLYNLGASEPIIPYNGDPSDPSSSKEIGLQVVRLGSKFARDLEEFEGAFGSSLQQSQDYLIKRSGLENVKVQVIASQRKVVLFPAKDPPTASEAKEWCKNIKHKHETNLKETEQEMDLTEMSFECSQGESILSLSQESLPASQSTPIFGRALRLKISSRSKRSLFRDSLPPIDEEAESQIGKKIHQEGLVAVTKNTSTEMSPLLDSRTNSLAIDNVTPDNSGAFKLEFQNLQQGQPSIVYKYLTVFILEMFTVTRGSLHPDPQHDAIQAVFYTITNDVPPTSQRPRQTTGFIMVCPPSEDFRRSTQSCDLLKVPTESDLYTKVLDLVSKHDPDIIAGYDVERGSWGYLIERGYALGMNLPPQLSRIAQDPRLQGMSGTKKQVSDYEMRIPGRILLNVWRLMRHEVALLNYTFENMMYHVLHTRVPYFTYQTLSSWWSHSSLFYRDLTVEYFLIRVLGTEKLLDQLDLIGRTSELASLFGIQFYEVLSRGSQFRVESMMLRLAKPMNYIPVSPSVQQRAQMRAPASLPLIMEPESRFYGDPVIVLDFQSLYPSMMIAYNYCFSTCLGRVEYLIEKEEFKFGCTELKVPLKDLLKLDKHIHISPAGVAFVDSTVRKGVLPRMLQEILDTRLMVKGAMKSHKNDKLLQKILHARQLGLKLIANVTYGYTSANFSGRMPCIEVGDSVVSKGRETLERAIRTVESTERWGARVVYGDTDSLFVLCPGRTRQEAFIIGQQIADTVTQDNPIPVKLKLEKVYQPCILQTKKRYVGFMYESADQETPTYDAKGIETVRRDGCPATSKILEKSLKMLFESQDVSKVKSYVRRQLTKVLSGRLSVQELTFAREYRGMAGYQPGACVPALKIARERLARDRRSEPRRSERVGYVITAGPPGTPLIRLARSLEDFIADPTLCINGDYYARKAILPPLDRCFTLLGVDVFSWYSSLPRKQLLQAQSVTATGVKKATIAQYFATVNCIICSTLTKEGVCKSCQQQPQILAALVFKKISNLERKEYTFKKICESCCGRTNETSNCVSTVCPIYYQRLQSIRDNQYSSFLRNIVGDFISYEF